MPGVAPARLPAADEVEALVQLRQQLRDLGGVVLEVAVDRDDDVAAGLGEAGGEGGRLAEVAAQPDDADARRGGVSRVSAANEPSVEPSSTNTVSHSSPAARAPRQLVVEESDRPLSLCTGTTMLIAGTIVVVAGRVVTAAVCRGAGRGDRRDRCVVGP